MVLHHLSDKRAKVQMSPSWTCTIFLIVRSQSPCLFVSCRLLDLLQDQHWQSLYKPVPSFVRTIFPSTRIGTTFEFGPPSYLWIRFPIQSVLSMGRTNRSSCGDARRSLFTTFERFQSQGSPFGNPMRPWGALSGVIEKQPFQVTDALHRKASSGQGHVQVGIDPR